MGDFNARVQKAMTPEEEEFIGQYTFEPETADPLRKTDEVLDNRQLFCDFCSINNLKAANTQFQKPNDKLATYREKNGQGERGYKRPAYEQIDFILVPRRWWSAVKNLEADTKANVSSDHYPIVIEACVKLKAMQSSNRTRPKYKECNEEKRQHFNQYLRDNLAGENDHNAALQKIKQAAEACIPTLRAREKMT